MRMQISAPCNPTIQDRWMQAHLQHIAYGFSSPKHTNVSKTNFQVESATCMESSECSDLGRKVIILKLVAEILSILKVSLRCKVYYDEMMPIMKTRTWKGWCLLGKIWLVQEGTLEYEIQFWEPDLTQKIIILWERPIWPMRKPYKEQNRIKI